MVSRAGEQVEAWRRYSSTGSPRDGKMLHLDEPTRRLDDDRKYSTESVATARPVANMGKLTSLGAESVEPAALRSYKMASMEFAEWTKPMLRSTRRWWSG